MWAGLAVLAAIVIATGAFYAARQSAMTPEEEPPVTSPPPDTREPGTDDAIQGTSSGQETEESPTQTLENPQVQTDEAGQVLACPLKPLSLYYTIDEASSLLRLTVEASKPTPCHLVETVGVRVEGNSILVDVNVTSTSQFCIQVISETFIQAGIPLQDLQPGNYTVILNISTPQGTCRAPAGMVTVQAASSPGQR